MGGERRYKEGGKVRYANDEGYSCRFINQAGTREPEGFSNRNKVEDSPG